MTPDQSLPTSPEPVAAVTNPVPDNLAADIERLILQDIHATLTDPRAPLQARTAAAKTYLQWLHADLSRQRLALEKAKFEADQAKKAETRKPFQVHEPTQEEIDAILDKLDDIMGISPPRDRIPPPYVWKDPNLNSGIPPVSPPVMHSALRTPNSAMPPTPPPSEIPNLNSAICPPHSEIPPVSLSSDPSSVALAKEEASAKEEAPVHRSPLGEVGLAKEDLSSIALAKEDPPSEISDSNSALSTQHFALPVGPQPPGAPSS